MRKSALLAFTITGSTQKVAPDLILVITLCLPLTFKPGTSIQV